MIQLQKYTWLIDTIRRAGKITHKELSDKWERCPELSDSNPLHRATFNRWRDAIFSQFGIMIDCQKVGGYLYYIANPEDIDDDKLKGMCSAATIATRLKSTVLTVWKRHVPPTPYFRDV